MRRLGLLLGFFFAYTAAHAAPLCVQVTGITPQCLYYDPGPCQREADRQGGWCAANPAELQTPVNEGAFCIVESGLVPSCIYPDRSSCDVASRSKNAACIAATPAPNTAPVIDPFAVKRPY